MQAPLPTSGLPAHMEEQHKHHIGRRLEVSVPYSEKETIRYEEWPVVESLIPPAPSHTYQITTHHTAAIPHRVHGASDVVANSTESCWCFVGFSRSSELRER